MNRTSLSFIKHRFNLAGLIVPAISMLLNAGSFGFARPADSTGRPISIIPLPVMMTQHPGEFVIESMTNIVLSGNSRDVSSTVQYFSERLRKAAGFRLSVSHSKSPRSFNTIIVRLIQDKRLGSEGYLLDVNPRAIDLRANTSAGLFYGVQTLLQLLPPEVFGNGAAGRVRWSVPSVSILDKPRFPWRGMHLDVCRHFFQKEFVKKYIDDIAMCKMNVFHWHLTDDQGWRIEIKKYPLLTKVGAWRNGSMIGPYSDQKFDSIRYGGFYTQADIREIVAYAKSRHVTIVPEIEMPGHSLAALASYPELSCTGGPFQVSESWGVFDDVFCPTGKTFRFLENVLAEVCRLFPGKYIHIGGDECPKVRWKESRYCRALMERLKLRNANQLQSYFVKRIERFLNSKGKQVIGWDEILEGGLAPRAAVMSWRGTEGGIAAAKKKHYVVMTPGSHCYFDHYQGNPEYEPLAIGGYTTVEKVYSYEPVPAELPASHAKYILGAQGNMWTEYVATPEHVEYMIFPRMVALAEVDWTPAHLRNYDDFRARLIRHFSLLDSMHVNYSKAIYEIQTSVSPLSAVSGVALKLASSFDSTGIHYTLDGSDPSSASPSYIEPLRIEKSLNVRFAYFGEHGDLRGHILNQDFVVSKSTGRPITLKVPPSETYPGDGAFTLVDGIRGDPRHYGRNWLGFWGPNLEATIDLGGSASYSSVTVGLLQLEVSWIYLPKSIEIFVGDDTTHFRSVKFLGPEEIAAAGNSITIDIGKQSARYVRVFEQNAGRIPDGKPGAGSESWLFVDEISIN
ncbi:MAG TPA: family 20 glycosylhydrolase [Bacteroidota bacterium]|nr:family 20 glycosylhydrolase [Bacteroidota bacterium]